MGLSERTRRDGVRLAELTYGKNRLAAPSPAIEQLIDTARAYPFLDIIESTSEVYARFRAELAEKVRLNAKRKPPRFLEDWIEQDTGKSLQFGENDLWQGAIALDRDMVLVTTDGDFDRMKELIPALKLLT